MRSGKAISIDYTEQLTGDEPSSVIQINYRAGTGDPARVFRSMAKLIDAFQRTDRDLAASFSASIEPVLILELVEAGSIRVRLITLLRAIDDEALSAVDWRPVVGRYLKRGKHKLLKWLEERASLSEKDQLKELQTDLLGEAPVGPGGSIYLPTPIPPARLLEDVQLLSAATAELSSDDTASYESDEETTKIDPPGILSAETIEYLLTHESSTSEAVLPLLVKKPDYLGQSRWEFRLGGKAVEARVVDEGWLERFHDGQVVLRPGDALIARVRSEVLRGAGGEEVATKHTVLEVIRIEHREVTQQDDFIL